MQGIGHGGVRFVLQMPGNEADAVPCERLPVELTPLLSGYPLLLDAQITCAGIVRFGNTDERT
jgi:hypothetical protein